MTCEMGDDKRVPGRLMGTHRQCTGCTESTASYCSTLGDVNCASTSKVRHDGQRDPVADLYTYSSLYCSDVSGRQIRSNFPGRTHPVSCHPNSCVTHMAGWVRARNQRWCTPLERLAKAPFSDRKSNPPHSVDILHPLGTGCTHQHGGQCPRFASVAWSKDDCWVYRASNHVFGEIAAHNSQKELLEVHEEGKRRRGWEG